jgi:hypothetical protein
MKSLAKRIRLAVLNSNPDFKTASDILQEILSRKERTASMPQHSVITLIADIYMSILFEMKVDAETESNVEGTYPRRNTQCSITLTCTFSLCTKFKI